MNNNQLPLQSAPPRQYYNRGGVYGGNQFNYRNQFTDQNQFNGRNRNGGNQFNYQNQFNYRNRNGGNQFNYRNQFTDRNQFNYRNQFNDRNNNGNGGNRFYYRNGNENSGNQFRYRNGNANNQFRYQNRNPNGNNNYNRRNDGYVNNRCIDNGYVRNRSRSRSRSGPPPDTRSRSNTSRSGQQRQNQSRQQRTSGPRQLRLNDFMPPQLRDASPDVPDLPSDFNLATTTTNVPVNALPQRQNFATTVNNTTQPFLINQDGENQQQQDRQATTTTTTASYRRRQRRFRQQQYQQNQQNQQDDNMNNNRFAALADDDNNDDDQTDVESNIGDEAVVTNKKKNDNKKNNKKNNNNKPKARLYLAPNQIFTFLRDDASLQDVINSRGNQAYVLASTSIYDEWVRTNYELQVWKTYLKMGVDNKHWAKEVVQRTKKRDDNTNSRFITKKINELSSKIAQSNATVSDLQRELGEYWSQVPVSKKTSTRTETATASPTTNENMTASTMTVSPKRTRDEIDNLEKAILNYIQHCTQHVKKMAEARVQLAKAQMDEFKALEDFEQIATPLQWDIHLTLKPKIKTWSTKNKNYHTALKRVEYDLPPKFITKTDLTFKIDESILSPEEAQAMYNHMRQLTKEYRTQAMTLYVQSITREYELLSNEIKRIIEGFPKENDEEGFDAEAGFAAFSDYHSLREKRLNLETEQSIYFLDEQRVEGEINKNQEEIVAPTLTRSLGTAFLLQT